MIELTVRLLFSLGLVIALLMMITKWGSKRSGFGKEAVVQVLGKRALTRNASVSVVMVGHRVLVLGTSEQRIDMLAELDPEELDLESFATEDEQPAALTQEPTEKTTQTGDAFVRTARSLQPRSAAQPATPPALSLLDDEPDQDVLAGQLLAAFGAAPRPTIARPSRDQIRATRTESIQRALAQEAATQQAATQDAGDRSATERPVVSPFDFELAVVPRLSGVTPINSAVGAEDDCEANRLVAHSSTGRRKGTRAKRGRRRITGSGRRSKAERKDRRAHARPTPVVPQVPAGSGGPLDGSVLSPDTWRQTFAFIKRRSA